MSKGCFNCTEKVAEVLAGPIIILVLGVLATIAYLTLRQRAWVQELLEKYEEALLALANYMTLMFIMWQVILNGMIYYKSPH